MKNLNPGQVMAVLESLDAAKSTLDRLIRKLEQPNLEPPSLYVSRQIALVKVWLVDAEKKLP